MPNDAYSQLALAADSNFLERLKGAMLVVALQVIAEDPGVANHAARLTLANAALSTPEISAKYAPFMVMRPNVMNFTTSYDFSSGHAVTSSGDADLQSQLSTDWTVLTTLP